MNPWTIIALLGALIGSNLWSFSQGKGVGTASQIQATQDVEKAFEAYREDVRAQELEFERQALQAERRSVRLQAEVAEAYELGKKHVEQESAKLVNDLRTGNIRLREQWAGCRADNLSATSTIASITDAAARDREESAARIVRHAAEADAQILALQALLRSERQAVNTPVDGE